MIRKKSENSYMNRKHCLSNESPKLTDEDHDRGVNLVGLVCWRVALNAKVRP